MSDWPLPLRLYGLGAAVAEPLAPMLLERRARRGKEDPARMGERLGRSRTPRPEGRLVWVHGASVGESLSHLPLIKRYSLERPDVNVLVTSGTRTSAEVLAGRLPYGAFHQYAPIDTPRAVERFLDHWRPDLGIFVESELWPNLLRAASDRCSRLALIGARVSERSARSWARAEGSVRTLLGQFDLIWTQNSLTRDWIEGIGPSVYGQFDLKRVAEPLPYDEAELKRLSEAVKGRQVVVAASTHAGEEAVIADAVHGLQERPLVVVVPRHPDRGVVAALALQARGFATARRSKGEPLTAETQAYVADTMGELGLFYRLADVAIVGGSLLPGMRGHNLYEPARLGRPVISGQHVDAFADAYAEFTAEKAVLMVKDEAELRDALKTLLWAPGIARALAERGERTCARGRETFDQLWADLQTLLPA